MSSAKINNDFSGYLESLEEDYEPDSLTTMTVQLQIGTTTDGKFLYTFDKPNLELTFEDGKLTGAKVL